MKAKIALITGTAALGVALSGCGGGSHTVSSPVASGSPSGSSSSSSSGSGTSSMQLDTSDVLNIIRNQTSDTAAPFAVNGGAVVFTPVDDSTQATVVDGT